MVQVDTMPSREFFTYAMNLVKLHRPHMTDWSQVARRRLIGLHYGEEFDWDKLEPQIQDALSQAPAAALQSMKAKLPTLAKVVNGWQMNTDTMGVYGDSYLKRAVIAMAGLGANQPVDAVYPMSAVDADGHPYTSPNQYVQHFEKDQIPPVGAFWSVTMYDDEGFPCPNELNRCAIGDRNALKYNPDGSLDLYYQHENPGPDRVSNWLPAPDGTWNLVLRLYAPHSKVLDGTWNPPAVHKVN